MPEPLRVLETCLYADDLPAAQAFYRDVLGLELVDEQAGRHVFFRAGPSMLLLFRPEHTAQHATDVAGQPIPLHGARGPGHAAFRIPHADVADWRNRLQQAGVAIESEVRWPNGAHSLYFRDPAGNSLELATADLWGLPDQE